MTRPYSKLRLFDWPNWHGSLSLLVTIEVADGDSREIHLLFVLHSYIDRFIMTQQLQQVVDVGIGKDAHSSHNAQRPDKPEIDHQWDGKPTPTEAVKLKELSCFMPWPERQGRSRACEIFIYWSSNNQGSELSLSYLTMTNNRLQSQV